MRTKILSFDEMKEFIGQSDHKEDSNNKDEIKRAIKVMRAAMQNELTDRQRECMELYFFSGVKEVEIAEMLGVNKSTVSRHISRGKNRLKKYIAYSCIDSKTFYPNF